TEPLTFSQHLFGNILSNAIKFAPVESVVSINALNDSENYYVQVINLAEKTHLENLDQVNSKSQVKSLPGTKGETGQGLGGQIVNQVARKLGIGFELRVSASDGGLIKVIAELKIPKPSQEQLEAA
ncbi:MAG: ATP-binding protein, partial [Pseudomonadota bacterium]